VTILATFKKVGQFFSQNFFLVTLLKSDDEGLEFWLFCLEDCFGNFLKSWAIFSPNFWSPF
jgi:hypothetical protein